MSLSHCKPYSKRNLCVLFFRPIGATHFKTFADNHQPPPFISRLAKPDSGVDVHSSRNRITTICAAESWGAGATQRSITAGPTRVLTDDRRVLFLMEATSLLSNRNIHLMIN